MTKFELAEFTEDAEYGTKLSAEVCDNGEVVVTIDEGDYNYYGDEDNCFCRDLIVNDSHIYSFDVDSFDIEQLQIFINEISEIKLKSLQFENCKLKQKIQKLIKENNIGGNFNV